MSPLTTPTRSATSPNVDPESNNVTSGTDPLPDLLGNGQHHPAVNGSALPNMLASPETVGSSMHGGVVDHQITTPNGSNDLENEFRFIGHLNPEGAFLAAADPSHTMGSGGPAEVGVRLTGKVGKSGLRSNLPTKEAQSDANYCPNHVLSKILLPHLEESCLSLLPITSDFEALSSIYFDQIHPIFPVVDRNSLETSPPHFVSTIVLKQVICLSASSSPAAKPFLRFKTNGLYVSTSIEQAEFSQQLSLAVRTSLSLGLIKDKLASCQILTLLSMSLQLADDRHLSAELCARAVACVHTLGLHLPARAGSVGSDSSSLFCCVWALDRLNAAFHGRPVCMHPRDIGRDLEISMRSQDGPFQLFLRTTLLLDEVIALYRPRHDDSSDAGWDHDFPDYESVVEEAAALRVKHNLLATIEIFYHAVAILSCRTEITDQRRSPAYIRQSLSAHKVMFMVAEDEHGQLSPFPIIPYAVSLALRFFYREFRFTKIGLFHARAQKQLITGCGVLRKFGQAFAVAAGIANLVEQTLNETHKVYYSLAQQHEPERSGPSNDPNEPNPIDLPNAENDAVARPANTEWSLWDDLPDFDVFEHFDPNFNLDAVDAALAGDTQPAFPMVYDALNL
ncbi:hypothetical protein EK21DRAFT_115640 [Setomelanomma holmii]|uniref:Xylanolytic transcriptional activator regulatory domain-containing protein n=1 Tax=Setomelanomma holmii TaxID=210430 RepID=A0A9P4H391_9PLEO|nr:hypothetical protein EK21DRAFT_115640 [Setomelanomma holmii]